MFGNSNTFKKRAVACENLAVCVISPLSAQDTSICPYLIQRGKCFLLSDKPAKFMPVQRFVGLQVIDAKGVLVGNVKDVSVDFHNRSLAFVVVAKNGRELDIVWDDVLSLEDVILLKKEMTLPAQETSSTLPPPMVQAMLICPGCGTTAPGSAKFCPRCGHSLK